MTLLTPLPWFAELPDARPLRRPAGAGGGSAGVRLGPPDPGRTDRRRRLYLGSITFHLSHLLLATAPAGRWPCSCPWPGRAAGPPAMRLGLPLLAAVALLLGAGFVGLRRRAPSRPRARRSSSRGPGRTGRPGPIWSGPARRRAGRSAPISAVSPAPRRISCGGRHDSYWAMDLPTAGCNARRGAGDRAARAAGRSAGADPAARWPIGDAARPVRAG